MAGFEERLSELVRNYPHLYDVSCPGHRDKQKIINSFQEIGEALGITGDVAKAKWAAIRERYVRAHNKVTGKKSGDGANGMSAAGPPILQRLVWLSPYISHRATVSNFPSNAVSSVL